MPVEPMMKMKGDGPMARAILADLDKKLPGMAKKKSHHAKGRPTKEGEHEVMDWDEIDAR
jgi:hypothetical protein